MQHKSLGHHVQNLMVAPPSMTLSLKKERSSVESIMLLFLRRKIGLTLYVLFQAERSCRE